MAAPRCPGARCQRDGGRPDGRHRRSRVRRGHGRGCAREQCVRPSSFRRIVGCRSRRHCASSGAHFSVPPVAGPRSWHGGGRGTSRLGRRRPGGGSTGCRCHFFGSSEWAPIGPCVPRSSIVLQHFQNFPGASILALLLLVVGVVSVGLAVLYLASWNGTRVGRWEIRRYRPRTGDPTG